MLRQNKETGEVQKNVRIEKGCIIDFVHVGKKIVLIKVRHSKWSYRWQDSSDGNWHQFSDDDERRVHLDFSDQACYEIARVISEAAGLMNAAKLVKKEENVLSFIVT